jgi:methanogenic corrinoid protein MtbC1
VRVEDPALFARRVLWLRRAMKARGADDALLRSTLQSLREALKAELPAAMNATVDDPIRLALEALEGEDEPAVRALDGATPEGRLGLEYLQACLEADTEAAKLLILDALEAGMVPQDAYSKVLLPAQREIGQLWHVGDVSVGEERLVSFTTRELMTLIVARHAPKPDPSRTVVLASVEGNAHDIGLRAVGDQFRLAGWRAVFLGADMPADDIAHAARSFNTRLIVLSATLTTHLRNLGAAIERIRRLAPEPKIMAGGLALADNPTLWQQLGADAYASSIDDAVAMGALLIAGH